MSKTINFLLYNPNFINGAGATTRILSIIIHLQRKYKINVYVFLTFNRIFKLLFNPNFKYSFYKALKTKKVYFMFVFAPLFDFRRIDIMLIKFYNCFFKVRNSIIQCETEVPAFLAEGFKDFNNKIVLDKHGLIFEETKYKLIESNEKNYKRLRQIKEVELISHKNSDLIICVSDVFKKVLKDEYGYLKKIIVLPMLISHQYHFFDRLARHNLRKQLGVNGKTVVVYSGSMSKYQRFNEMVDFFHNFHKINSNSFFLILSQMQYHSDIEKILTSKGVLKKNYYLCQVSHNEVNSYLSCSDIGLLFREDITLNNVASPTKFLEYLATGIYPIISSNIGDTEKIVNELDYGFIIKDLNFYGDIDQITSDYNNKKSRRIQVSLLTRIKYNWHKSLKKIEKIYER